MNCQYCIGIFESGVIGWGFDSKTIRARKSWSTRIGLEGMLGDRRGKNRVTTDKQYTI